MNLKKHYKLYKSGKLWVTAAIATLALTAGMAVTSTTNASADDQQPSENQLVNPGKEKNKIQARIPSQAIKVKMAMINKTKATKMIQTHLEKIKVLQ